MDEQQHYHHHQLAKHCRICGSKQQKAKSKTTTYDCTGHRDHLLQAFRVDISSDAKDIHPTQFCQHCYCAMRRAMSAAAKVFHIPPRSSSINGKNTAVTVGYVTQM